MFFFFCFPLSNSNIFFFFFCEHLNNSNTNRSTKSASSIGPLVIPLLLQRTFLNQQKASASSAMDVDTEETALDAEAREAILAAVSQSSEEKKKVPIAAIPLLLQNTVSFFFLCVCVCACVELHHPLILKHSIAFNSGLYLLKIWGDRYQVLRISLMRRSD